MSDRKILVVIAQHLPFGCLPRNLEDALGVRPASDLGLRLWQIECDAMPGIKGIFDGPGWRVVEVDRDVLAELAETQTGLARLQIERVL